MLTVNKEDIRGAYQALSEAERVLIVAHQKPDGDTTGSSLALWHWLLKENKNAHVFCRHLPSDQFHFLPLSTDIKTDEKTFAEPWDIIVTCDAGDLEYAGIHELIKMQEVKPVIINFDHHASNKLFGDHNLVDSAASSTAEVVFNFFGEHGIEITKEMAMCLMTAVFTDTGGFSNAATNQRALEMAARLAEKGASIPYISRATLANKNLNAMRLWGRILARLKKGENGIAYTYVLKRDFIDHSLSEEAIEGLANYLSHLSDSKAVMVISERGADLIKVSMRTYHEDVDLSRLAAAMGGGGHKKAAGFTVPGRLEIKADNIRVCAP